MVHSFLAQRPPARVREMTRHLAILNAVALPADPPEWILLLPQAEAVRGRDGRTYRIGDRAALQALVETSLQVAGQMDLVVDYDHQSDLAAVPGVGGTAPAAGWIKELQVRDDGIWGRVEWTETAAQRLRAREYRYISPVFTAPTGRVERLLRAGLTNKPNFDLPALNHEGAPDLSLSQQLRQALGLAEGADETAALAAIERLKTGASGLVLCAQAVGLGAEATAEAVQAAIRTRVPNDQVAQLQSQLTEATTRLSAIEAKAKSDRATAAVDAAIKGGKLAPALRDWGLQLAQSDEAGFAAYVEKAPAIVGGSGKLPADPPNGTASGLDNTEAEICAAMGITPEAFKKAKEG